MLVRVLIFICLITTVSCKRTESKISIDGSKKYQIIDGFGGTEHWLFPRDSEYPLIFDDLGTTILRFRMLRYTEDNFTSDNQHGNEVDNDNADPFTINWNRVNTKAFDLVAPMLKAAQERGVKLYGNIMCPPPWMKTSNMINGPGSLKSGLEEELVEFIFIWVKGMQKYHNVHIDYVNFENEPNYQRNYPSCYMSPTQIKDLTKRLGMRFKSEGITTGIVPPETSNLVKFRRYADSICQDSEATEYSHRLSTHSYNIDFFDPDENIKKWRTADRIARKCGKALWLTEYCLDYSGKKAKGTWIEALKIAQHVHNALVHGNVAAWLYHELYRDPSGSPLALIDPGKDPYPKYYALKQYFRYVRPGAARIEAHSDHSDILVTAFLDKQKHNLTLVVINRHSTSNKVEFSISNVVGLTTLDVIRTSAKEKAAKLHQVIVTGDSFSYSSPAGSITTFIGPSG